MILEPLGITTPSAKAAFSVVLTTTSSPVLAFLVSSLLTSSPLTGRSSALVASGALAVPGTASAGGVPGWLGAVWGIPGCVALGCGISGDGEFAGCCAARERLETTARVQAGMSNFTFFMKINLR